MTPAERTNLIIAEVADKHCLTLAQLLAKTQAHHIAHPRQEAMYALLARTDLSTVQVARKLGKDHTTIIFGADRHAERNGLPYIRDLRAARAEAEQVAA